jgi:glycosyltransferase involved in cell wall biosynthesis
MLPRQAAHAANIGPGRRSLHVGTYVCWNVATAFRLAGTCVHTGRPGAQRADIMGCVDDQVPDRARTTTADKRTGGPRVTVVVPAHNAGRYLGDALESIRAQTMSAWQAIIVDDSSEDDTAEVSACFIRADPRFQLIRLERNAGPAGARNAGLAAADPTELIALLDADDLWHPEYLAKQVARYDAARAEGRKVGIVACNATMLAPNGVTENTWFDLTGWIDPIEYEPMLERSYIFVSALFPRSAWEEVGGFATECWGSEDYDLWLQLLERGYEAIATREPLATYRLHEQSLSHSRLVAANAHIAAYERALRRGPATKRRERAIKRELRHYRAVRQQAAAVEALQGHRLFPAAASALNALPLTVVATLQRPRRWGEWLWRLTGRRSPSARRRRSSA